MVQYFWATLYIYVRLSDFYQYDEWNLLCWPSSWHINRRYFSAQSTDFHCPGFSLDIATHILLGSFGSPSCQLLNRTSAIHNYTVSNVIGVGSATIAVILWGSGVLTPSHSGSGGPNVHAPTFQRHAAIVSYTWPVIHSIIYADSGWTLHARWFLL